MSRFRRFVALFPISLLAALGFFAAGGCDNKDPDSLPEWTPADHDNQVNPQAGQQVDTSQPRPEMPQLEKYGINDVVLATWKQNCVPCHGLIGRGDGPQAGPLRPRDLTDPAWQRVAIDSEIAYAIKNGRGRMPAFSQIPDETVQGLVRLVRLLNAGGRPPEPEAAAGKEPGSPPTASPAHPAPRAP